MQSSLDQSKTELMRTLVTNPNRSTLFEGAECKVDQSDGHDLNDFDDFQSFSSPEPVAGESSTRDKAPDRSCDRLWRDSSAESLNGSGLTKSFVHKDV